MFRPTEAFGTPAALTASPSPSPLEATVIPFPGPRYLLVRREIDGSDRPLALFGRPLIYRTLALALVFAKAYGDGVRVHDTALDRGPAAEAR